MADKPKIKFMTPRGVSIFPNIHRPSQKFGKFECKLRLDPADEQLKKLVAEAEKMLDEFVAGLKKELIEKKKAAKVKELKVAPIVQEEYDDEGNETGFVLLKATAAAEGKRKDGTTFKRTIRVFDARNKAIEKVPAIYGGSELKMAGVAFPYYSPSNNQAGITFRLEAVQLLKLVGAGGSAERYGFGVEEDGYAYEETEGVGSDFSADDSDDTGSEDGDADF